MGSDSSSGGRRGNWITDTSSKSAAPDEAAVRLISLLLMMLKLSHLYILITGHNLQVRRILAEPSAYATRPATAGSSNAVRPVGGQRMVDSGVTRGMQKIIYVFHTSQQNHLNKITRAPSRSTAPDTHYIRHALKRTSDIHRSSQGHNFEFQHWSSHKWSVRGVPVKIIKSK